MSIEQQQLRKSAGKPQCKDGTESASVNPLTHAVFSVKCPKYCQHQQAQTIICELQLCISL